MPGPLEPESPALARLFEHGSLGVAEEVGPQGPEVVAYFDSERELGLGGRWEDVEDVDYVAAYRAGLEPVRVGPLVIAPTHRSARVGAGEQVVWCDPGTAFGTGHHETTRLALAALADLDLVGRSVLDVGAGSGILAIAADRMGARLALGVDIDGDAVRVAKANATLNRSRARFLTGSIDHAELPARFDVVVANLYAELHVSLMAAYTRRVNGGGRLLLTGILTPLEPMVREALPAPWVQHVRHDGEWSLVDAEVPG